jgi:hypothetical protein
MKERNLLHWFDLSSLLLIKSRLYSIPEDRERIEPPVRLAQCIERATLVVRQLERVSEDGTLLFLYDAGACMLSNFGIVTYIVSRPRPSLWSKLYRDMSTAQKAYVYGLLERVWTCCLRAQLDQGEGAMKLCGRFLQRVLQVMRSRGDDTNEHTGDRLNTEETSAPLRTPPEMGQPGDIDIVSASCLH